MSTNTSQLRISYTGERVRVDRRRINREMFVPNLGREDARHADEHPGQTAASLFDLALTVGALISPDALQLACYGDDDADGGGIILVAFTDGQPRRGVTCGWRDVRNIARIPGEARPDNDPMVVAEALGFMAAELNTALAG